MGQKSVRARLKKIKEKNYFEKKTSIGNSVKKEIKKALKTKKGLSCKNILRLSRSLPKFIGCFSEDKLVELQFPVKPCYLLVNTDSAREKGTHWIAIALDRNSIEIFDPLGFQIFRWPKIPCKLLNFIHCHSTNRKLVISDRVQSSTSLLCGFFCLFFVFTRPVLSLKEITSLFSKNLNRNDKILYTLF